MSLFDINQFALRLCHPFSYRHLEIAKKTLEQHSQRKEVWDGPTTGPKAAKDKKLVILAADMGNGGIAGVTHGIQEAADLLGWDLSVIDGEGTAVGRTAVFGKALTLKADGLIINGFDSVEQKAGILLSQQANIPIVAWHASEVNGPDPDNAIFANITTDAKQVAETAALWAYADANAKPGIVMVTDTTYQIAIDKSEYIHELLYQIGSEVIDFVDIPIASVQEDMESIVAKLWKRHGKKWTYTIAINDIYFDYIAQALKQAGAKNEDWPISIAAGDGSASAYQRIRDGLEQAITIAEPLNLQGWQMVDEMNRAFNGEPWSGYQTPMHLVTKGNVGFDGGEVNAFDPENAYREKYSAIWL